MASSPAPPEGSAPPGPTGGGRRRRSVWAKGGRAHIEVRAVHRQGTEPLARHLEAELGRLKGVDWAEVDQVAAQVVVSFDEGQVDLADVLDVVSAVEEAHGVADERFPANRPEHPGDPAPIDRQAWALAADVAGLGLSLFTRVLRANPLSAEVASLVGLVDSTPQLRRPLEDRFGPAADLGLAAGNALAQALAGGPLGLAVDGAHRVLQLQELRARKERWEQREPELMPRRRGRSGPGADLRVAELGPPAPSQLPRRPAPLPAGPVERYTSQAVAAGLAAAVGTVAVTKDPRLAVAATVAATPKAARLGREAFAARLGALLAARGVLTMDPAALRRLELVDTVVLDADVLRTGHAALGELWAPEHRRGHEEVLWLAAQGLLDPPAADPVPAAGSFTLAEVRASGLPAAGGVRAAGRLLARAARLMALREGEDLAALVQVRAALDPLTRPLAAVAQEVGDLFVAGHREDLAQRLGGRPVAGGTGILREVRRLQGEGRVVALVSSRQHAALRAADVGIGLARTGGRPPLGAHLVTGEGLADAWLLLQAVPHARQVSRRTVSVARYGAGVAGLLALTGPRRGATTRATVGVNGAAAVAIGAGTVAAGAAARRRPPPAPEPVPWHALGAEQVLGRVGSRPAGLEPDEVGRRSPPPPGPQPERAHLDLLSATAQELANPLTPALGSGAALSAAAGSFTDAALIGTVLGLNALLGGLQRVGADRALRRLLETSAVRVHVRRGGTDLLADAEDLVVGDVVVLHAGDAVPADCRVLEAHGVQVDEASLTGESGLVTKQTAPTFARAVAEHSSMLYAGTSLAAGDAVAVVVAVGEQTELGRSTASSVGRGHRPGGVEQRLRALTAKTVPAVLGAGAAVVAGGLLHGRPLPSTLSTGVGLAVAAVPEGLPTVATVAQLAAARRLAARGALVRHAATVEALGRVDVLCADKTGTLTTGLIALRLVSDGASEQQVGALDVVGRSVLAAALRACPVLRHGGRVAHPTDRAVIEGAAAAGVRPGAWRPAASLPFEPSRGYHAVLGTAGGGGARVVVKGAPEVVLPRCARWRRPDGLVELDDRTRRQVEDEVHRLARSGYRVLAVAERSLGHAQDLRDEHVRRLELCGLLALGDPVRETAAEAVHGLRAAGVGVLMVTGDHPSTAAAVAAELGLLDDDDVLTGPELDAIEDDVLPARLENVAVLARVTPEQKVRVVRALQRAGHVVAMTGDGANDAAAIALADVGFALGEHATNAAKEAADVVVTDERIETIIDAILEGRAMWAAVRDAVAVLLGGNLGEVAFTVGTGLLLPGGSPLNARQLLLVNLLTDLVPALALAVRPPVSTDPQRLAAEGPEASLGVALTRDVAVRGTVTAAAGAAGYSAARLTGLTRGRAGTTALASVVGSQLAQTLVAGWRSPLVVGSTLASAAALAGVIQTPGLSQFFGCRPLGPLAWAIAAGSAVGSAVAAPLVDAAVGAVAAGPDRGAGGTPG